MEDRISVMEARSLDKEAARVKEREDEAALRDKEAGERAVLESELHGLSTRLQKEQIIHSMCPVFHV